MSTTGGSSIDSPFLALPPRKAQVTEDSWWSLVDGTKGHNHAVGAGRLIGSCIHAYGWSEAYAVRILKGYCQFMDLKVACEDWTGQELTPPRLIDLMWQQHILDVGNYVHDCVLLWEGRLMVRDPTLLSDRVKIVTTKLASKARFGKSIDSDVWDYSIGVEDDLLVGKSETKPIDLSKPYVFMRQETNKTSTTLGTEESDLLPNASMELPKLQPPTKTLGSEDSFKVHVWDPNGSISNFSVTCQTSVLELQEKVATECRVPPDDIVLMHEGKQLNDDTKTMRDYGIKRAAYIGLVVKGENDAELWTPAAHREGSVGV